MGNGAVPLWGLQIETQTPATAGIQNEAILEADTNNPTALESPSEFFSHGEGDSPRSHAAEKTRLSVLGFAVLLTLSFSVIELVGGWWANSLALIGDAGHMVTDSMSLLFALVANRLAMKGADEAHSFGHGRVEVIAAFVNGLTLLGVTFWLFYEAIERIREPAAVAGGSVMVIAFAGLLINVAVAWSLSRDRQNVNTRAALLHVLGFSGGYRRGRHHLGGRSGYCRSAPFDVCRSFAPSRNLESAQRIRTNSA